MVAAEIAQADSYDTVKYSTQIINAGQSTTRTTNMYNQASKVIHYSNLSEASETLIKQFTKLTVWLQVPSKEEGSAVADAVAAAGGIHTDRGGGFSAGSRRAAAAGSAAACTQGGARRAAPPSHQVAAHRQAWARPLRRPAPAAPSARCHQTATTTFAAASLRSACL